MSRSELGRTHNPPVSYSGIGVLPLILVIAVIAALIAGVLSHSHEHRHHHSGAIQIASPETAFLNSLESAAYSGAEAAPRAKRCMNYHPGIALCTQARDLLIQGREDADIFVKGQFNLSLEEGSTSITGGKGSHVLVDGVGITTGRYPHVGYLLSPLEQGSNGEFLFLRHGRAAGNCPLGCEVQIIARRYTLFVHGQGDIIALHYLPTARPPIATYQMIGGGNVATLNALTRPGFTGYSDVEFGTKTWKQLNATLMRLGGEIDAAQDHVDLRLHLTGRLSRTEIMQILFRNATDDPNDPWENGNWSFIR